MNSELVLSVEINASKGAVWATLTESKNVQKYMFGSSVKSDWAPGSSIEYIMPHEGRDILMVHGVIIKAEKPSHLEHTLFPTTWEGMEDIPKNHLTILYSIEDQGGTSLLTITQGGFDTAAEGEKRYQDSVNGLNAILPKIKEIAESID